MRSWFARVLLAASLAGVAAKPAPLSAAASASQESDSVEDSSRWAKWFYGQRTYPIGAVPDGAYKKAVTDANAHNRSAGQAPSWTAIGPGTIPNGPTDTSVGPAGAVSGRVSAIAVDPANPTIVYVGSAQGGVWKTTDGGASWLAKTDHEVSLAISALLVDPNDSRVVYAGTGDPTGVCDSYFGVGVLKSTDGGETWTLLSEDRPIERGFGAPFTGLAVSRLVLGPDATNPPSTLLSVTTARGVTSAGTQVCPSGTQAWEGALWSAYYQTDGRINWLATPLVPYTDVYGPGQRVHDMVLDPTDNNVAFVAVRGEPIQAAGGIWKTTRFSAYWDDKDFVQLGGGFPPSTLASPTIGRIALGIGSGPAHRTLYAVIEGVPSSTIFGIYKTIDGGSSWEHLDGGVNGNATVQADQALLISDGATLSQAAVGRHVIVADGNALRSLTIVSVASDGSSFRVSAPLQQTHVTYSVGAYPNACDGACAAAMAIAVDPNDPTGDTVIIGGNWQTFSSDVNDATHGSHTLWRTTDGGSTWGSISQGDAVDGGVAGGHHAITFDGHGAVYDGNDGGIWKSTDEGASWTNLNKGLSTSLFTSIALHPSDANIALGGALDLGTLLRDPSAATPPSWFRSDWGEGGNALIDPRSPSRMLHSYFQRAGTVRPSAV